jgi:hypothetical protein
MGRAAGAIAHVEREKTRHVARLERELARITAQLEEVEREIRAHDAALVYLEHGSWQEAARIAGYVDGSSARQAVETRTDYLDVDGARRVKNRQHRVGRLSWLPGAEERRRAGKRGGPP